MVGGEPKGSGGAQTLYEKARDTLIDKPEDLRAFNEAYSDTFETLKKKYGEEYALTEMIKFLEDTLAEARGKMALIEHDEEVKRKTEAIEDQYTTGW